MPDRWTTADLPDLSTRTAVVTGANAGLGREITAGLAARGAHVVMACRDAGRAQAAVADLRRRLPSARLEVIALDLADLDSVRRFAEELGSRHQHLDLLVENAGLMAVDRSTTVQGFETQLGVNHLGHFALTAHLLPLLLSTPGSRIGVMSSMGHRAGRIDLDDLMGSRRYARWGAYFQSKLANLLFVAELDRRLRARGAQTVAVAAHPGGSRTELGTQGTSVSNRLMSRLVPLFTQSAAAGAEPMLRALTDPEVSGGELFGPRWLARGRAVRETPSRAARDAVVARRLWEASATLTGVEPLA